MRRVDAIIFDKDGTLFDFRRSWGGWAERILREVSGGDARLMRIAGEAIGYELEQSAFRRDSILIAGTSNDIANALAKVIPLDVSELVPRLNASAAASEQVPVPGVTQALEKLGKRLTLGVVTNDAEAPALAHLKQAGLDHFFDFIAGYDSGFGAKPAPGQLLAFADRTGANPSNTLMVGDSRHDLIAGRAAGMRTVAVLTGIATNEDLADLADVVLEDIGSLPDWIAGTKAPT